MTPSEIAATIARRDRAFRPLIREVGPPPKRRREPVATRFASLAESITSQLLATKAAETIHQRIIDLCEGDVAPASLARAGHARLRAAGLSNAKAAAMLDLSARTLDGRLRLERHGRLGDHEVLTELLTVRGIGPWSAHMYLMHALGRPDVWPPGDYGVRKGWSRLHGLDEVISERELKAHGELFAGVRSDVAWYCWRAIEGPSAM